MKKIFKLVKNCGECLYCKIDYYESPYNKSGYDCIHPQAPEKNRIINRESGINIYNSMPDWCPLENEK